MISVRNNFNTLENQIIDKIELLMISGTKLGNSLPNDQFFIYNWNAPYKLDHNAKWKEFCCILTTVHFQNFSLLKLYKQKGFSIEKTNLQNVENKYNI